MESVSHEDHLRRAIAVRDGAEFSLEQAAQFFVAGVSGKFPRGRAVLMDHLRIGHLAPHAYEGAQHCEVCGLPSEVSPRDWALKTAHDGHSSNELMENVLIRWEEALRLPVPEVGEADRDVLRALLECIADAEAEETPGALEKRIAKAKVLKKTDKYKRLGILQTLAECRVLPNDHCTALYDGPRLQRDWWAAHHRMRDTPRSDIVLPLAGWRGRMGVDMGRAREVFGI